MLDFYGINLLDESTGEVSRSESGIARYKETFLRPYTNHEFRVKRMLEFLNVTGYRIYAVQLVKFFEKEIFKTNKVLLPPLKSMELTYEMDWKPYGDIDEKDKRNILALEQKCCLLPLATIQEHNSHLRIIIS